MVGVGLEWVLGQTVAELLLEARSWPGDLQDLFLTTNFW